MKGLNTLLDVPRVLSSADLNRLPLYPAPVLVGNPLYALDRRIDRRIARARGGDMEHRGLGFRAFLSLQSGCRRYYPSVSVAVYLDLSGHCLGAREARPFRPSGVTCRNYVRHPTVHPMP